MKHVLAALALTLTVAACSELPELEPGTCGNFVLDPGEDCDEDSALCVGCRLACAPEPADLAEGDVHDPCPVEGYACGVDAFCHAPSGVFAPSQGTSEFRGRQLAITNIDRDGVGDVVGVGDNLITVSYGDPSGVPTAGYELLTPFVRGVPAFAPLVAVSVLGGVAAVGVTCGPMPAQLSLSRYLASTAHCGRSLPLIGSTAWL